MADILNRCLKCKCSLACADKTSKLLPCLHTMCDDCISGRTDVAEKIKRLKEEREQKRAESELVKEEKQDENSSANGENEKTTQEIQPENEKSDPISAPTSDSVGDTVGEQKDAEASDRTTESESGQKQRDDEKGSTDNTDNTTTESGKPAEESRSELSLHEETSNCTAEDNEPGDNGPTKTDDQQEANTDDHEQKSSEGENNGAEQESASEEQKPKEVEENMEVEEEIPPDPVPLTECPVCREPFSIDGLIENVFIRKQAATSDDGEGKEQKCTGCESNPANSYCLQCDDWLCGDCVNAHKRVRMTKDHQLTSLEEAIANKGGGGPQAEVSMLCRLHPKEKLTLFCEKCEVLTCRDCQLLQHQEHKYQFLQEAADSYKAKLTGSLSLMKERRDILKRNQTEIEERLAKVKREKNELQQDILRQADVIVKAVRAAVWSVLSSLHSFTDAAAKRLSREVGDVEHLVGKFDHCISFMEGILSDGFGLPLLFSKVIVETKCRKVYHTHMEPQSLKGQLNIQYRHDVPAVIRSLPHIGAIYVNGSKYPPEKSSSQPPPSSSSSQSSGSYRASSIPSSAGVGGSGHQPQGLPHHLAPQERSLYMQMMMNRSHGNTAPSQGPTLSLPSSRRVGNMGAGPRGWPGQQLGLPNSQGSLMAGMISQSQSSQHQMMAARAATFTPMRLHHRPVDPTHMSSGPPPMVLGTSHRPPHSSHAVGFTSLPAPPPLRSPAGQPQYRGAAEGVHMNSGGQAAMSGIRRAGGLLDTSPDPARPASGGHNTPERPLSGEGAASSIRVKPEMMDSTDCIITSANFKTKKSVLPTSSLGELQKNLDEVIRGVPLDLGDNLEQINGGDALGSSSGVRTTAPPPALVSSPPSVVSTPTAISSSTTRKTTDLSPAAVSADSRDGKTGGDSATPSMGTDHSADGENSHQVKGYVTGNSMPGFTLAAVESVDPNDDYCAACHQGGDVLCCDQCPRVFHLQCHVPILSDVPSGTFVCTLCENGLVTETHQEGSLETPVKRKAAALSDNELKVCQRMLLELICHPSSIPFHEPVSRAVPNYYKIITNPMDFSSVKNKLIPGHSNSYTSMESFLDDCKLIFKNCAIYNSEMSEVGKAGRIVHEFFYKLVDRHMPDCATYARQQHESPESEARLDPERKKRRLTPPPHSGQGEKPSGEIFHVH